MSKINFENISKLDKQKLYDYGFRPWPIAPSDGKKVLMLIPVQHYNNIPNGTDVVNVHGRKEVFIRGGSSDENRFGMLQYGIMVRESKVKLLAGTNPKMTIK